MNWPIVRTKYVFANKNIRGIEAPLASATTKGVELRDALEQSVWNPGDDVSNFKLVEPNDFVIGLRSFQHGISFSNVRGLVSPAYTVLKAATIINPHYYKYYFRSSRLVSLLENISQGIRQGRTIDIDSFFELPIPVPPLPEQQIIADFLDAETARIDALIAKKRRMIELGSLRVIAEAAALTRTGNVVQLRRLLSRVKTGSTPRELESIQTQGHGIEWLSPTDFGTTLEIRPAIRRLRVELVQMGIVPRFPKGTVVIVGIGATAGRVGHLSRDATGNQQLTCLTPAHGVDGRFLAWQLIARSDELRATAPYTTLPIINNDFLRGFPAFATSLDEQRRIAKKLDAGARRAERLREAVTHNIELLQERRQALITAAVTGEMEIPGVSK